ncbi:AraC family transcriptional regulator [Thalassotalea euphylliae]|uniref:AraC family transcriptional regulator n=1 Tax=Thalassotalea euphylliae TaxID=1655234 RepID=A0A3E0TUR7_9GAMM|nr:AraC family transcriptional regulator [Thalassotalea euphylliae]REL28123.1 AraC family transcriptional regulator [Thalassotalea euphylliae]
MAQLTPNNISISTEFVRSALARLHLPAQEIEPLLVECQIAPSLLSNSQSRLSLRQFGQIITALTKRSGDELLGHSKQPLPLGSLSLLLHWLLPLDNLEQVVQRLPEFYRILGKGIEIEVIEKPDEVEIRFGYAYHSYDARIYISEYGFFFVHRILSWLTKQIIPISQLHFPFTRPSYARDYRLMFYGAPVEFEANAAVMSFSKVLMQQEVVQNREALEQLLTDPFTQLLMLNFSRDNWTAKVVSKVQEQLSDLPTLPELAAQMQLTPHTLQRRLAAEGSTYLAIKNQVKRDSAIELLVNSKMTIEAISEQLGFSETSPFTRTFKEWTGVPPSAYRKHR